MSQIRAQFDPVAALAAARKTRAVFDPNTALKVAQAGYTPSVGLPAEGASPLLMGYQGGYAPQQQDQPPPRSALGEGVAAFEHGVGQLAQMTGMAGPVQDPFQPSFAGEDAGFGRNAAQYAARLAGGVAPALAAGVATGGLAGPAAVMGAQGFATSRERGASVPAAAGAAAISAGLGMLPVAGALGRLSQAPGVRGAVTDLAMGAVGNVGADVGTELLTRAGGGEAIPVTLERLLEQAAIGVAIPGVGRGIRALPGVGRGIGELNQRAALSRLVPSELPAIDPVRAWQDGYRRALEQNGIPITDPTYYQLDIPDAPKPTPEGVPVYDPYADLRPSDVQEPNPAQPDRPTVAFPDRYAMEGEALPVDPRTFAEREANRIGMLDRPRTTPTEPMESTYGLAGPRPEPFVPEAGIPLSGASERMPIPFADTVADVRGLPPKPPRGPLLTRPPYQPRLPGPPSKMPYRELKAEAESLGVAEGPKSRPALEQRIEEARAELQPSESPAGGEPSVQEQGIPQPVPRSRPQTAAIPEESAPARHARESGTPHQAPATAPDASDLVSRARAIAEANQKAYERLNKAEKRLAIAQKLGNEDMIREAQAEVDDAKDEFDSTGGSVRAGQLRGMVAGSLPMSEDLVFTIGDIESSMRGREKYGKGKSKKPATSQTPATDAAQQPEPQTPPAREPWMMTRGEYEATATDRSNREDYARAWTPIKTPRGQPNTIEFVPYQGGGGVDGVLRWNDEAGVGRGVLAIQGGKVSDVAVDKPFRRKGIATKLYAEAAKRGATESKNTTTPAAMLVRHKQAVRQAIAEGRPVPSEVLADYQDLRQPAERTQEANQLAQSRPELEARHRLPNPIIGKTGAKIVGYQWMSQMEEGMYRDRRVSDWSRKTTSEPTGRDIVHVYWVQTPDGETKVMGIGAAKRALGMPETRLRTIAEQEQRNQRIRTQQWDTNERSSFAQAAITPEQANAAYRKANSPDKMMWGTPEQHRAKAEDVYAASRLLTKDGRYLRTGDKQIIDEYKARGWTETNGEPAAPTEPAARTPEPTNAVRQEEGQGRQEGLLNEPTPGAEPTPAPGEAKTAEKPIDKARRLAAEKRRAEVLDVDIRSREFGITTRKGLIDKELEAGYTPAVEMVVDEAALQRAKDKKAVMDRGWVPTGNERHPKTIEYRELQRQIADPPKKPEYRMVKGDGWRVLTKIEYDYARDPRPTPKPATPEPSPARGTPAEWNAALAKTPQGRQYLRFKEQQPGAVLAFRIGDFYEFFGEDAVTAHKALGLTLTQRGDGVPMAGIPHHQLETYLQKFIKAGHRVAVAEQVDGAPKGEPVKTTTTPEQMAADKPAQPAAAARAEGKGTVVFGEQRSATEFGGRTKKAVGVFLTDGKENLRRLDLVKDGSDWDIVESHQESTKMGSVMVPKWRRDTIGTVVGDLRRAKAVAERVIRGELDPKAPVKVDPGFEPDASIAQGWRGSSPTEDASVITDGTVMVKADAMSPKMAERLRKAENSVSRGAIPKNATDSIWNETVKNAKTEGKLIGYAPDVNHDVAVLDLGGKPMTINGAKFKLIADATGADGFRAEGPKKPLLLTKNGEPVALVMPMNLEGRAPELPGRVESASAKVEQAARKTAKSKATRGSTPAEVLKSIKDDLTNKPAGIIAPGSGVSLFDPQFRESLGITIAGVTGRLQGKSVPKIVKADPAAGEAAVEHASAKLIAQAEAHRMARETLGPRWKDKAFDEKLGAVMTEANLRMTRDRFLAEGDTDSANNVATLVGGYFKDEAAFKAAVTDPAIKAAIGRDNNSLRTDYYQQAARHDPNLTVIPPADFYGVSVPHISLKRLEDGSPNAVSASTKGNVERPSPFRRRRTGSGDAYEISYKALVENSLGKNIPIATLKAFHDSLIESGNAVSTEWKTQPKTIKGEPVVAFKVSDGRFVPAEGRDDAGGNYLFVRRSLADEVAAVTKEDQRRLPPSWFEKISHRVAGVNLALGFGDFTTHMLNIGKALMTAPGVGANGVEKIAGSIGGVPRLFGAIHSIFEQGQKYYRGDKATLDRAVELAKMGTSRGKYHKPSGGLVEAIAGKPVADAYRMVTGAPGRAIEAIDLYTRLSLDDAFTTLVKAGLEKDTPARRREFINGNLGQYNSALQGRMVRWARQTGVGPFATAGTTFNRVGVRNALLSPGTPGKNLQANMKLRALKIANLGGTIATVAMLNYLRNGDEETPPGVPVGAHWWRSDDGKVKYVDIIDKATGIRRGLKALGAAGAVDAMAKGQPIEERRAAIEALNSWIHPFAGPAPQAAVTAATGKGLNIDPATGNLRQVAPLVSPTDPRRMAQTRENIAAAGRTVIGQLADPTSGELQPMGKFFGLGPFTPVEALPEKVAKDLPRIHQWQDAAAYMDDIRRRAYRVDRPQRYKFLQESIRKLPPQMQRRAWQELRSTLAK